MSITKIQTGGIPALAVTHDKLHTDMDLSTKTVTLPTLSTLNTTGNVGIGTSSPSTQLEVKGSTYSLIRVNGGNTNNAGIDFGDTDDVDIGRIRYDNSSDAMQFWTNNAERMRIDSSGNVGVGTSSFGAIYDKLAVAGGINIQDDNSGKLEIGRYGSGAPNSYIKLGANSSSLRFTNNADNADLVTIENGGNVGIGTTSPETKLDIRSATATYLTVGNTTDNTSGLDTGIVFKQIGNIGNPATIQVIGNLSPTSGSAYTAGFKFKTGDWNGSAFSSVDAMTIAASGNVGIGTDSPRSELSIAANNSGQGAKLTLENTDTSITSNDVIGQIDFYANDSSTNGTGAKVNIKAIAASNAGTVTALTLGVADSASATAAEVMRLKANEVGWSNTTNGFYNKIYGPTSGDIASGYLTYNGSTLRGGFYTNPSHGLTVISEVDMSFRANNANRMHINTSGIVTTPNVPAFLAFKSNGPVTSSQIVLWNNIYHNNGGHYSATTGKFTAPVEGYYNFTVGAIIGGSPVDGTQRNGELQIQKNGSYYSRGHWNHADRWENVSYTQVIFLAENDEVRVYFSNNTNNNEMYGSSLYSHFGGFLIG